VHDASLDLRLWEDRVDGLREALQAVHHRDQHILDAAVFQLGHHAQPEFGALRLLDPDAQNLLGAIGPHA
jgi:hypothetical protein